MSDRENSLGWLVLTPIIILMSIWLTMIKCEPDNLPYDAPTTSLSGYKGKKVQDIYSSGSSITIVFDDGKILCIEGRKYSLDIKQIKL